MGIEMTSGFDSQMINALQIVPSWVEFFNDPQGSRKGIISAAYALGAIISLPFIPVVLERYGRRWGIFAGSWVMVIGAIIQCFSQNSEYTRLPLAKLKLTSTSSRNVRVRPDGTGVRNS